MPKDLQSVLEKLKNERDVAIRGGAARVVLLGSLIGQRTTDTINKARINRERKIKDLDMFLFYQGSLREAKKALISRAREIMGKLKDIPIPFREECIEPFQDGRGSEEEGLNKTIIKKILDTRDLTINEVVLVPQDGQWRMYYSPKGWRDSITGVGMLNAQDPALIRWDSLRKLPGPRGFWRLFRALVEGIVEEIWLPEWQLKAHFSEMRRRKMPLLGRYSLLIIRRYKDSSPTVKAKWMQLLHNLKFTNEKEWERFVSEQRIANLSAGEFWNFEDFSSDEEMSIERKISLMLERKKKRKEEKRKREKKRDTCLHKFFTFKCEGCDLQCVFYKCEKCTKIVKEKDLPLRCNTIFKRGNWKADRSSLISWEDISGT